MTNSLEFRRIQVEEVDDVTIVRFVDRKILEEQAIHDLGEELFSLVDEIGKKKILLDFRKVEHLSSAALNKLFILWKKVRVADGKLVLCNMFPEIEEVFTITRLKQAFSIASNEEEAWHDFGGGVPEWFYHHPVQIACPVHGCGSWITSSRAAVSRAAKELISDPWTESCPRCCTAVTVFGDNLVTHGGARVVVIKVSMPTYEDEHADLVYEAVPQAAWNIAVNKLLQEHGVFSVVDAVVRRFGSSETTVPYRISLTGRLDLFASEVLERAWQTVPPPRRIVVDLRHTTEISGPGVEALLELSARPDDDSRTSILINKEDADQVAALSGCSFAYDTAEAAIEALGDIPEKARRPLRVTIRLE